MNLKKEKKRIVFISLHVNMQRQLDMAFGDLIVIRDTYKNKTAHTMWP